MRLLITGGRGFLGGYIQRRIGPEHDLIVTDLHESAEPQIPSGGVTPPGGVKLDVRDKDAVAARFKAEAPDLVLHLAALCGAIPSTHDPHGYFETNLGGTLNVLEGCRLAGVKRLLFTSSLTVFGKGAVTEDSPFAPRHPYASSKAAAEIVIRSYVDHYGLSCVILRPTLVVGEGCKELHAIGDFLHTAQRGDPIEIFGDGGHQRDFMHPEDVAEAVAATLQRWPEKGLVSYNLSTGEFPTMADLARLIIEEAGGRSELRFTHPTSQTFSLYTSSDRAERDLGWQPKLRILDMVRRLKA
ncbi:MAG: NAD-dependent epimerase/dehydratase family protein [Candidatus Xenobia bacterium]